MTKKRLGELLLQEGVISDEQLKQGLDEQQQTGELVGDILVRKGFCTESDVARTISTQFSFPYISVQNYYVSPEMAALFPLATLERNLFVPIDRFGDVLSVVVAGLLDQDVVDEIEQKTSCTAQVYVGMVSEVKQVIKEKFAGAVPADGESDMNVDVTAPPENAQTPPAPRVSEQAPAVDETIDEVDEDGEVVDLSKAIMAADGGNGSQPPDKTETDAEEAEESEGEMKHFRFFEEDDAADGGEDA
jgi:type IV pilus assembly protein PilB